MNKITINPNWERLNWLVNIEEDREYELKEFQYYIQLVTKERIIQAIDIIKENNLQEYQDDILLLCSKMHLIRVMGNLEKGVKKMIYKFCAELQEIIQFFKKYKASDVKITIESKKENEKIVISSDWINYRIAHFLEKEYEKENIKKSLDEKQYYTSDKGRKSKHIDLGLVIHRIQLYLQEYTHLKAEEGISISNQQADFIYWLFDALGISNIKSDTIYHIDIIRNYLSKYREQIHK